MFANTHTELVNKRIFVLQKQGKIPKFLTPSKKSGHEKMKKPLKAGLSGVIGNVDPERLANADLSVPGVTIQNVAARAAIFMDLLILLKAELSTSDQVHKKGPLMAGLILCSFVDPERFELSSK